MTDNRGAPHVAAMVQNVSLADDNRLCKQVEALCSAGYRVTVITRRDDANEPWRNRPGLTARRVPGTRGRRVHEGSPP